MKLHVDHPEEPLTASVGFDKAVGIGWFASVKRRASTSSRGGRVVASVDALETGETSLGQVLEVLSSWGFWSADDFSEALALMPLMFPCEMSPGPRRVAEILETLKSAAAGE